jgi:predicted molibdopterin-dependent oxidoreductase YjgC
MELRSIREGLVTIHVNGEAVSVPEGSNLAAVLMEQGHIGLRLSEKKKRLRGVFCGMGVCFECLVKVGGEELRACQTQVEEGMEISVFRSQNA